MQKKKQNGKRKKEKIIRSGNANAVKKISDKLTDDELRRADNRINEKNRLDSMTGRQQQGQQFVQQKSKEPIDVVTDFNKWANTAVNTYNNVDKIIKAVDDLNKYSPEGRAKEAERNRIIKEVDVDAFLANPGLFNTQQKLDFNKARIAYQQTFTAKKAEYDSNKQSPDYGPQIESKHTPYTGPRSYSYTTNRTKAEYQQYMNDNRDAILDYWDAYNRN